MTDLTDRILVPIANEDDATRTVAALEAHLEPAGTVLQFVHVIEKAGGAPDKAPLEAREQQADRIFEIVRDHFAGGEYEFDTKLEYATDVPDEIIRVAEAVDATAIAFVPRPGGLVSSIFGGDLTDRIVSNDEFPVIVFPEVSGD